MAHTRRKDRIFLVSNGPVMGVTSVDDHNDLLGPHASGSPVRLRTDEFPSRIAAGPFFANQTDAAFVVVWRTGR